MSEAATAPHTETDAGMIVDKLAAALGSPEFTQQRVDALLAVRSWLSVQMEWMEAEAVRDQPWEVRYVSATNPTGKVCDTFVDEAVALRNAASSNETSCFGQYKVTRARRPLD